MYYEIIKKFTNFLSLIRRGRNVKHNCLCICFIRLTTCFGRCGPSSSHRTYNEEKLYSVRSLVVVQILNFQRDLVFILFIRIELIIQVMQKDCRGFNNSSHTIHSRKRYIFFFYLIEKHSQFLLRTLQVLYMCTLCDSTNISTIIEFLPNCM